MCVQFKKTNCMRMFPLIRKADFLLFIRLADEYLAPLQSVIPDAFIGDYVDRYLKDLEEASAYIKSQVIMQMKRT